MLTPANATEFQCVMLAAPTLAVVLFTFALFTSATRALSCLVHKNKRVVAMACPMAYFTVEGRLKTFQKFGKIKGAPLCNPLGFAEAGFICMKSKRIKDLVQCFACGKQLDSWEPGDDPWKEHVKRGGTCPFVLFRSKKEQTFEDFLELHLKVRLLEVEKEGESLKAKVRAEFEKQINSI